MYIWELWPDTIQPRAGRALILLSKTNRDLRTPTARILPSLTTNLSNMPVTLNLCNTDPVGFSKSTCVDSVNKLFVSAAMKEKVTDTSFPSRSRPAPMGAPAYSETLLAHQLKTNEDTEEVHQRSNGLVHALEAAYSNHRPLVLRPDDVWHAILTQLSIYVNKNSERLRSTFVEHKGQKMCAIYFIIHLEEPLTSSFAWKGWWLRQLGRSSP